MAPVRIAAQIHPQHADYGDIRRAAAKAEELGVDVLYNWDHFYPLYAANRPCRWQALRVRGPCSRRGPSRPDRGSSSAASSPATRYRNPELLADMARTVDHISGGRLIFGIGSGWFEKDYDEYGYEFGTAIGRLHALDEAMPVIKARLSQLDPQPTGPLPILIGGGGEKVTLRIVAENADIWHGFGDVPTFAHKNTVLDEWCAKVGRDPSEIERSVGVNPAHIDQADAWHEAGAVEFTIGLNGPDYDMGPVKEWLAWRDQTNAG